MKTFHSAPMGILAFFPIISLYAISLPPMEIFIAPPGAGRFLELLAEWWFFLYFITEFSITLFFSAHAFRHTHDSAWKRTAWITGFWLIGPVVFPAYWWTHKN
ncbi:hypothetical protein [Azovibrio restrictus]|uniref:hypothetical protein n=1 Tax=Azovibrio restrictus TaxID=146938 RepID=UPI0012EC3010|nr:hypothetical protein [Azovibrio restrictus]